MKILEDYIASQKHIKHADEKIPISELVKQTIDDDIYLDILGGNPLQRKYCWDNHKKSLFVLSVFAKKHIPPLSIIMVRVMSKDEPSKLYNGKVEWYEIIDGKQRLNAIRSFIDGDFPLNIDGVEIYYSQLSDHMKNEFLGRNLLVNYATSFIGYQEVSEEEKLQWFITLNYAGTPADVSHFENLKLQHQLNTL